MKIDGDFPPKFNFERFHTKISGRFPVIEEKSAGFRSF